MTEHELPLAGPPAAQYLLGFPLPAVRRSTGIAETSSHLDLQFVALQIWPADAQARAARFSGASSPAGAALSTVAPVMRLSAGELSPQRLYLAAQCADGSLVYGVGAKGPTPLASAGTRWRVHGGPYSRASLVLAMPQPGTWCGTPGPPDP